MASKQPQRTHLVLYLKLEALITLVSMCILPFIAILVASEAIAASKWPPRSQMASDLNSLISITYVEMCLWLLNVSNDSLD